MLTLRDKFFGCFFGSIIGDVLGMPYEFKRPGTFYFDGTMEAGGPFVLEAGQYTDDTSMMLAMAHSILNTNKIDSFDQALHYVSWYKDGKYSVTNTCFDIGDQTRMALDFFIRTGQFIDKNTRAGNGSLMRATPAILFNVHKHHNSFEDDIRETCINTHNSDIAIEYTIRYSTLVQRILLDDGLALDDIKAEVDSYDFGDAFEANGYILTSYYAALRAVSQTSNFKECMINIINVGGDTDTNACIAGMMAGALYGYSGLPQTWLYNIQDFDKLYQLCEKLWKRVQDNTV